MKGNTFSKSFQMSGLLSAFWFSVFSEFCLRFSINWAVLRDALRDTSDLLSEGPHSTRADQTTLGSRLNGNSCSFFAEALEKAFDTKKDQINNEPPLHAVLSPLCLSSKADPVPSRFAFTFRKKRCVWVL